MILIGSFILTSSCCFQLSIQSCSKQIFSYRKHLLSTWCPQFFPRIRISVLQIFDWTLSLQLQFMHKVHSFIHSHSLSFRISIGLIQSNSLIFELNDICFSFSGYIMSSKVEQSVVLSNINPLIHRVFENNVFNVWDKKTRDPPHATPTPTQQDSTCCCLLMDLLLSISYAKVNWVDSLDLWQRTLWNNFNNSPTLNLCTRICSTMPNKRWSSLHFNLLSLFWWSSPFESQTLHSQW
jgi:hypothetical protein